MGIDFGTKRVGIALSDEGGSLARPVAVLKNGPGLFEELEDIIEREDVESILIGISPGNAVQGDIAEFIGGLTLRTMLPIETINEAFTSAEAHGQKGKDRNSARTNKAPAKPTDLDARAAAVILQRFLDTK